MEKTYRSRGIRVAAGAIVLSSIVVLANLGVASAGAHHTAAVPLARVASIQLVQPAPAGTVTGGAAHFSVLYTTQDFNEYWKMSSAHNDLLYVDEMFAQLGEDQSYLRGPHVQRQRLTGGMKQVNCPAGGCIAGGTYRITWTWATPYSHQLLRQQHGLCQLPAVVQRREDVQLRLRRRRIAGRNASRAADEPNTRDQEDAKAPGNALASSRLGGVAETA